MPDEVRKRLEELLYKEPVKIEIRKPPRRNSTTTYVSLAPIGVKPDEKVMVVTYDNAILVLKL